MISSVRPAYRRAAALFILVLLVFGLWSGLAEPALLGYLQGREEIAEMRHQLGKFQSLAATSGAAEQRLSEAKRLRANGGAFLREATPALASAALQTRLRAIAGANDVVVAQTRTLPIAVRDGITTVGLRISLKGEHDALKRMLHAVESNVPYLVIDNLDLRPVRRRSPSQPGGFDLNANLDVIGFLDAGAGGGS